MTLLTSSILYVLIHKSCLSQCLSLSLWFYFLIVPYIFEALYSLSDFSLFSGPWDVNPLVCLQGGCIWGSPWFFGLWKYPNGVVLHMLLSAAPGISLILYLLNVNFSPELSGHINSDSTNAYAICLGFQLLRYFILLSKVLSKGKFFDSLKIIV